MNHYYFVGIAGTAMASVAGALKSLGHHVSGSDRGVYPPMSDFLASQGIPYSEDFDAVHIRETADANRDTVFVIGNAMSRGNPEVEEILDHRLSFTSLAALVGTTLLKGRTSIVVAGTHGKTSTASLAAWALESAGFEPGFLIGGIANNFAEGCRPGREGSVFVTEGDEYDTAFFDKRSKFIHYRPDIAIINNIEFDHADIFSTIDDVVRTFRHFVNLIPRNGLLLVNGDDMLAVGIARQAYTDTHTFGFGEDCSWRATEMRSEKGRTRFTVRTTVDGGRDMEGTYEIPLTGSFNVRNALAVVAVCARFGVPKDRIAQGFSTFLGVKRRMEIIAERNGITVIDDFAHHPTAVRETLKAVADAYPERRVWALFEPRSNTTTRNIFQQELAGAFDDADVVIIGAVNRPERYRNDELLSTDDLIADLQSRGIFARHIPDAAEMADIVLHESREGDVIVLLSNGSFGGARERIAGIGYRGPGVGNRRPGIGNRGSGTG